MNNDQKYINITHNNKMPIVGFGTYLIKDNQAESLVYQAINMGYRHIDTAEAYGNENGVGRGLKKALEENNLSRTDIFVTTKLWPGNEAWGQTPKTYETTVESLENSLSNLQLEYVDLYLIHAPFPKEQRLEQWRAMADLKKKGKIKAIGVSNYGEAHIEEIKSAGLPVPDANQIELHPWSQKPKLVSYLSENNITIIAYSSLVPLSSWRNAEGQGSAKSDVMKAEGADLNSPFKIMAKKYGVTEAQILLKWGIQKGYAVLPKSVNVERMKQNIDLFHFEIDDADMELMSNLDRGDGVAWSSGDPINEA